ncbi:MAG TPA: SpoIIE family protein phosphatase [Thermoanaerobaculia bacterium]
MKIRTQLIVAFLLLAVVPLTGIVLYSYFASLRAVRRATDTQARSLAGEMEGRMASIREELGRGAARIAEVPAGDLLSAARSQRAGRSDPRLDQMVLGFGEAAPFLRSLEFVPVPSAAPPASPAPPAPPSPPGAAAVEAPHAVSRVVIDVPSILRKARKQAEDEAKQDPEAMAAIDLALGTLENLGEIPMPAPAAPGAKPPAPPPVPSAGLSRQEIERMKEEIAAQAEKQREALQDMREAERKRRAVAREQARVERMMLGRRFEAPVRQQGKVVGMVKVQIRGDELLRRVLARTRRGEGEVPFAIDAQGKLHTANEADRRTIESLPLALDAHAHATSARWVLGDWVVATRKDPESGLIFGIAHPMPLRDVRRTAARNFGYGLGMIALALFGILPLSTRMTRNLKLVTREAERISQGDLDARVPVRSRDEFGVLALTFNRMAEDLKRHKEREIEQALLQTEYERKTRELEEARRFQLSLLPKTLPEHPAFEIAVSMRTATEVGGDYYDFHLGADGELTVAVGDATGHGAVAGTMVTVVKSLFSADAGASAPPEFLGEAARAVKRMELGRMAMGLCLARLDGRSLVLSSAGMPPVFVHRRESGETEEIALQGMPLGGLASEYQEQRLEMAPGDTILLLTDGLPELTNAEGDPLGYPRVRSLFASLSGKPPEDVIAGLANAAESWTGGEPPKDDITLVVVRMRTV